ncbi:hypothetical protein GEMRC1_008314 [Eukaryota sp. GEM-RC1]
MNLGTNSLGEAAKKQFLLNPGNTFYATKRLIGRKYKDPQTIKDKAKMPYKIVNVKGQANVLTADEKHGPFSPSVIAADVLSHIKTTSERYLGRPITKAVITVPAHFNDQQRNATKEAGKLAGLDVVRIINEPTAASLAYGIKQTDGKTVAVYDLGGGTFDVTILRISNGVFEVMSTNGDTFLGGEDFDQVLQEYLVSEFIKNSKIDVRNDRIAMQRIREEAEKAKIQLSSAHKVDVSIPFLTLGPTGPVHLNISLSRDQLESLTKHLVDRTITPCRKALKDAGLTINDVDEVVLVGGMTRMPAIQNAIQSELGAKICSFTVNPDEAIAAAGSVDDVLLLDVTPLSLGIETSGGVFSVLIPRNTTVPTKRTQTFSTVEDNQTNVSIKVLQGESKVAKKNHLLGEFDLTGLPPKKKGEVKIDVTFDIDSNGIVNVSAVDKQSNTSGKIGINLIDEIEK